MPRPPALLTALASRHPEHQINAGPGPGAGPPLNNRHKGLDRSTAREIGAPGRRSGDRHKLLISNRLGST